MNKTSQFINFPIVILLFISTCSCGDNPAIETDSGVVDSEVSDTEIPDSSDTKQEEKDIPVIPPPPPVEPVVDPTSPNMFDLPYPSDIRRTAEGGLDMSTFPNPHKIVLLENYLTFAEEVLKGYSLTPSILFQFTGTLDTSKMPLPAASREPNSVYQLVNVDPDSDEFGTRHAVRPHWWDKQKYTYVPNFTLGLNPIHGIPLQTLTTYAAFVTTDVVDMHKQALVQSPIIRDALEGDGDLAENLAPLKAWIEIDGTLSIEQIATATVFTTGDPTKEMWTIRDFIRDDLEAPVISTTEEGKPDIVLGESPKPYYAVYEGHYPNPNFQSGEKPYNEGGDIHFGEDGKPIVQSTEQLRFALTIPKGFEMPETGWPLVLYGHGTGGDWKSFIETQPRAPAREFAERGVAMLGIDQPLHGDRFEGELDVEIYSFNFFNGRAGRSNFRQSAIDVLSQIRFVREGLKVPADVSHTGQEILIDPDNVFFMGHSHGGISAGIFAPLDTDLKAIIMSGGGGGLSSTIIERKTPVDIKKLMEAAMGIESDFELVVSHPVIGLVQNLVDATDPLSFAPFYRNRGPDEPPINIMMTEGTLDAQTPPIATESLAAAARIPILDPPATDPVAYFLLGMEPIKTPVKNNYKNKYGSSTAFLMQFDKANHWAIFNQPTAVKRYIEFVLSAIQTGTPSIQ